MQVSEFHEVVWEGELSALLEVVSRFSNQIQGQVHHGGSSSILGLLLRTIQQAAAASSQQLRWRMNICTFHEIITSVLFALPRKSKLYAKGKMRNWNNEESNCRSVINKNNDKVSLFLWPHPQIVLSLYFLWDWFMSSTLLTFYCANNCKCFFFLQQSSKLGRNGREMWWRVISWFDLKVSGRGYREQETLINKLELRYRQELLA